jgi:hypothetical protein
MIVGVAQRQNPTMILEQRTKKNMQTHAASAISIAKHFICQGCNVKTTWTLIPWLKCLNDFGQRIDVFKM